jgi:hypothetical protein
VELFQSGWAQLGFAGIVLYLVLLIATGRLVPRSVSKALVDQANHNAEIHQQAAAAADQRADLAVGALTTTVGRLESIERLVRALGTVKDTGT